MYRAPSDLASGTALRSTDVCKTAQQQASGVRPQDVQKDAHVPSRSPCIDHAKNVRHVFQKDVDHHGCGTAKEYCHCRSTQGGDLSNHDPRGAPPRAERSGRVPGAQRVFTCTMYQNTSQRHPARFICRAGMSILPYHPAHKASFRCRHHQKAPEAHGWAVSTRRSTTIVQFR